MATIKSLTKANVNKLGIIVREDLDFTDDGSRFRGFSYKGLPLTQCVYQGETFLAIRVDYLNDNQFTTKEWMSTEEYKLADEFNGCFEIDTDKLIENLERIIAKVDELNKAASAEVIDMTEVKIALTNEIKNAEEQVEEFKQNYKWYEANEYELKRLADYTKSEIRNIEIAKRTLNNINELERREKKRLVESLNNYGYVKLEANGFYLSEMKEALARQK